jgi:hypothetical protein
MKLLSHNINSLSGRKARRALPASVAASLLALGGAACSTPSSAAGTRQTTSTFLQISTTTIPYVPHYMTVAGHKVLIPVESHNEPVSSYSNAGQSIIFTANGFAPAKLYASHTKPIVFTNLTSKAIVVKFYDWPNYPKPFVVPAGGTYAVHYDAQISLAYALVTGKDLGRLYIDTLPGVNSSAGQ